jgi:hypothetical protein
MNEGWRVNRIRIHRLSSTILTVAALLLVLFITGCAAPKTVKSRADFDRLTQRHGMGHFYYIGSEGDFHYFASSYLAERTKFYRYPKANYALNKTFPKTREKSQWIPYLFDLNANARGFRGEPQQPIK